MPRVVYVVRSPLHTLSQALLSEHTSDVILSLEDPLLPGRVLRPANNTQLTEGERLPYEQVLKILLASKRVITL